MRGGLEEEEEARGAGRRTPLQPQPAIQGSAPKSPPLSAAASQGSLVASSSDLATSEPDLSSQSDRPASSLASSSVSLASGGSRPPSSSSGVASPDPPTDIAHAVEQEEALSSPGVLPAASLGPVVDYNLLSIPLDPAVSVPMKEKSAETSAEGNGGANSDVEEEYFEEYHLPNTHEQAFVRHQSFRRKVELTPINAPDAEKIEGLVRTGELQRHGSVRRKIVANVSAQPEEIEDEDLREQSLYRLEEDELVVPPEREGDYIGDHGPKSLNVHEFSKDFRQIRNMMDNPDEVEELESEEEDPSKLEDTAPRLLMRGKNTITSTPNNNGYASTADYATIDLSASLHDQSSRKDDTSEIGEPESMTIEQSTINKVKECMDFSKYKDLYSISGKLQDMLTKVEVEEVLSNSHRYVDYIDSGVLEVLFNSVSEQMSLSGQPMSITFNKLSTAQTEKEERLTKEDEELQNRIKQKLLMEELALDSLPFIETKPKDSIKSEQQQDEVVYRKKKSSDGSDDDSRFGTIERRKSVRVSTGQNLMELEGVFIESDFKDSKMKTISAPTIDLVNSNSQEDLDWSETRSNRSNNEGEESAATIDSDIPSSPLHDRVVIHPDLAEDSNASSVPSIRITQTESSRDDSTYLGENSSVNNLYMEESSEHHSEDADSNADDSRLSAAVEAEKGAPPRRLPTPPPFTSLPPEGGEEERHWRSVVIGGVWRRIDMKVIGPYRNCISAGGQHAGHSVVVVSACKLPERSRPDYSYVMDNLFVYLLSRLEQLVSDDYILVYLSGGRNVSTTGPSFHWLKAAYQMIDRKLRKDLQALLVVHPTLWVRTIVALTRPFISSKFYRKLTFVYSLTELAQLIPLDQLDIPDSVKEADFEMMIREKKKEAARRRRPSPFR